MSKGSKRRPPRVREEVIERNWRRTFSPGVLKMVQRKVDGLRGDDFGVSVMEDEMPRQVTRNRGLRRYLDGLEAKR